MFYGYRLAGTVGQYPLVCFMDTDWPVTWKEENNKQINQSNFGDNFSALLNVAAVVKISDEFEQNGGRSEQ